MKKLISLFLILNGFIFAKDVYAQVGCCTGTVTTGEVYCPSGGNDKTNWYCTNTSTAYGCGGLDYSTCVNTRPDPTSAISCGQSGVTCTGCGWSTTACSGGGGIGEPCSNDSDCSSGRCSAQRGICVDAGGFICPEDPPFVSFLFHLSLSRGKIALNYNACFAGIPALRGYFSGVAATLSTSTR
jgi:hypothetical protein